MTHDTTDLNRIHLNITDEMLDELDRIDSLVEEFEFFDPFANANLA